MLFYSGNIDENLKKVFKEITEQKRLEYWSNVSIVLEVSKQC